MSVRISACFDYSEMYKVELRTWLINMNMVAPQKIKTYHTTPDWCGCPDRFYRKRECKHIKALRYAILVVKAARG